MGLPAPQAVPPLRDRQTIRPTQTHLRSDSATEGDPAQARDSSHRLLPPACPRPWLHTKAQSEDKWRSPHGSALVFAIDLADFFPSINFGRVRGLFMAYPFHYPDQVATLLARICSFRNALPQGAPTSPIVSNYICRGMDRDLARLAMSSRSYYTRYADDLVFSTDRQIFPVGLASHVDGLAVPSEQLTEIIEASGFLINPAKTRLQIKSQRQRVTGLVVNEKVNVPRNYLRGLRALLYVWEKHGKQAAAESLRRASPDPNWPPLKPYPNLAAVVRGRVQYVGSIRGWDDPAYLKLAAHLSVRDPTFRAPMTPPSTVREAHLYTEGPTDVHHVRAALHYFHVRGELTNLKLVFDVEADRGSELKLQEYCERLQEFGSDHLSVCLFDTDTKIAREAVGQDGWREYGPRTVAVGLAPPPWSDPHAQLCIELLHADSILRTKNAEGRRLYQTSEFHPTTSLHLSEPCAIPHIGRNKRLIQENVYEAGTHASIGRSKANFARAVEDDPGSFDDLDFEGFRPTLNRILEALASLPGIDTMGSPRS